VGAFEREGQTAETALEEVVEAAAKEAAKAVVCEIHHVVVKEVVAKEATTTGLRKIRHEEVMSTVARKAVKVTVRELRHGVAAREVAARMYAANVAAEEAHVVDAAKVATAWTLADGDETEMEDCDEEKEVVVVQRLPAELEERAAASRAAVELLEHRWADEVMAASPTHMAAQLASEEVDRASWENRATEVEKTLAYRREADRYRGGDRLDRQRPWQQRPAAVGTTAGT
jgi:hypothetical protein